jgi:L-malate glycosyltransferase
VNGAVRKPPVPLLLTVRELNLGGIERDATKLAIHIDRARYAPRLATFQPGGLRHEELKQHGVPVLDLGLRSLKSPSAALSAIRLARYIREHRIAVVHSMDVSSIFVAPVARLASVPVVLSSMLGSRMLLPEKTRRQLRFNDRVVDGVVVNCEAMRRHMVEEGVEPGRIELCYNGIDTAQFHPAEQPSRPEQVAEAPFVIGAVCVLRPEKALHLLQEAFSLVRHVVPGMKLLIVGSGPELATLRANAERLGLGDSCVFQPATPEVPKFLRGMDVFVQCSLSEAFSNALLEALATGCCAVGSRVGGTPEIIGEREERGLLFESGNAADLARDPEFRRELARRGSEWIRQNLGMEVNAARNAEIYDKYLALAARRTSVPRFLSRPMA